MTRNDTITGVSSPAGNAGMGDSEGAYKEPGMHG
jgi:hypothetical protein